MKKLFQIKIIVLILFFNLYLIQFGIGQTYSKLIRPNVYWDVQFTDGSVCNLSGGNRYFFLGDSIIQGIEYNKIYSYPIISTNPGPYCPPFAISNTIYSIISLLREDTIAKKVFYLDINSNTEHLLYDFSLNSGDTLFSQYAGQGNLLIVDSIGNILLNTGGSRKIIYLNNGQYYIESIGGSQGLFFPMIEAIGGSNRPGCVIENGLSLIDWPNRIDNDCFYFLNTNNINPENYELIIYPNPTASYTTIKWKMPVDEAKLTIIDISGRKLVDVTIKGKEGNWLWDTRNISNGIYLYELRTSTENLSSGNIAVQR